MDTTITVETIKVSVRIMPDDDKARVMRARSFRCSLPLFLVLLAGCNRNTRVTNVPPPPGPPKAIVVVAVGDISCDPASKFYNQGNGTAKKCHMLATSSLAISIKPEAALLLGDTQYDTGSPSAFEQSYAKTWGRKELKDISYPSIGNHEYRTKHASGYFDYFGARAGDQRKGYYSFDLGTWHLIALNSGGDDACRPVSCDAGSDQERWLHDDLAQTTSACTLAFWHRPLFSSGELRESIEVRPLWRDLYDFIQTSSSTDTSITTNASPLRIRMERSTPTTAFCNSLLALAAATWEASFRFARIAACVCRITSACSSSNWERATMYGSSLQKAATFSIAVADSATRSIRPMRSRTDCDEFTVSRPCAGLTGHVS